MRTDYKQAYRIILKQGTVSHMSFKGIWRQEATCKKFLMHAHKSGYLKMTEVGGVFTLNEERREELMALAKIEESSTGNSIRNPQEKRGGLQG